MERTEISLPEPGSVIRGMFIWWGLNLLTLVVGLVVSPMLLIGGIGLVQLFYVWPLYNGYKGKREESTCNGLVIAASVTALLNAGCWGSAVFGG